MKQVVDDLEARVRALLADLVPTSVRMSYRWSTSLGAAPRDEPIFKMVSSTSQDLEISADIAVDLVTNTRTAIVRGQMRPFLIHLLGPLDIATITFNSASFESRNGSAPAFRAEVGDVQVGTLLTFLKPLQAWLSPSGDGFYVKPILNPPGIEAGYSFDADVIPLGAILFINVALGVSAQLPLTDSAATFKFHFASLDRPLLIVAPPYGGGGYVALIANAQRIVGFQLSFVFGAVIPIKFGPLSAQGRVVAGILLDESENGGTTIGALIEASGEGHIACFGISVCLRVKLIQNSNDGNALTGSAEFSFEFSFGIGSITFRFRAGYTARNDKSGALSPGSSTLRANAKQAATPKSCPSDEEQYKVVYRSNTPRKSIEWDDYRRRVALDLLKPDHAH